MRGEQSHKGSWQTLKKTLSDLKTQLKNNCSTEKIRD
jgi:hypothetical protein